MGDEAIQLYTVLMYRGTVALNMRVSWVYKLYNALNPHVLYAVYNNFPFHNIDCFTEITCILDDQPEYHFIYVYSNM